jgi:hypothetical protein
LHEHDFHLNTMPCQKQMPKLQGGEKCVYFFQLRIFFLNYAYQVKLANFLNLQHFPL